VCTCVATGVLEAGSSKWNAPREKLVCGNGIVRRGRHERLVISGTRAVSAVRNVYLPDQAASSVVEVVVCNVDVEELDGGVTTASP
jgi:hypothetical protein